MYDIFTYIWLIFMVNVAKYTNPMDPMVVKISIMKGWMIIPKAIESIDKRQTCYRIISTLSIRIRQPNTISNDTVISYERNQGEAHGDLGFSGLVK